MFPKYCLEPTRPKTVTITFPDGKQYRFNAVPSPQCQLGAPINGADMTYVQIAGDSGTGGATLAAVGNNSVIVDASVPGLVNLVNISNQRIYNPTRFQLTTAEKYVYTIDQTLGVTAMTDPNGNTLTINTNGVIHSGGKSIVFNRDASGRITKVTDPSGNELTYGPPSSWRIRSAGVHARLARNRSISFSVRQNRSMIEIEPYLPIAPNRCLIPSRLSVARKRSEVNCDP